MREKQRKGEREGRREGEKGAEGEMYNLEILCSECSLKSKHPLVERITQWYVQLCGRGGGWRANTNKQ